MDTDGSPFRFLSRTATAERIKQWRERHRLQKSEERRNSDDEAERVGESPEGMFVSASDTGYPEPRFEDLEIKLVRTIPFLKQRWYDWDNIKHGSFRTHQGPHYKDAHEIEFTHKPTGTHWTLSIRPKDFHRFSVLLSDPDNNDPRFKRIQKRLVRRAGISPIKRDELSEKTRNGDEDEVKHVHEEDNGQYWTPTEKRPVPKPLLKGERRGEELVEFLRRVLKEVKEPWNILGETWAAVEERRRGMIVCGLIELSRTSLIGTWHDGVKGKEGWVKKRRGGRKNDVFCFPDFLVPRTSQQRWLALRSNYLLYFYSPMDITPQEVLLIDGYFQVLHKDTQRKQMDFHPRDEDPTGNLEDRVSVRPGGRQHHALRNALVLRPFNKRTNEIWVKDKHRLAVLNGFRDLLIDFHYEIGGRGRARVAREWVAQLELRRERTTWFRQVQADVGRYDSFAPVRLGTHADCVKWMVDASAHFEQVYDAIVSAEKEILIADWFITPEIFLRRGADGIHNEHLPTRLDRLLFKKANEGVRIYILLYKEMNLPNASLHAKEAFMARKMPYYLLDPAVEDPNGELELKERSNIVVLRHPDQGRGFIGPVLDTVMWAHHEKAAIIDRKIAFIGGIDLCVGRYDTAEHTLRDDLVYNSQGHLEPRTDGNEISNKIEASEKDSNLLNEHQSHKHGTIECSPLVHDALHLVNGEHAKDSIAPSAENVDDSKKPETERNGVISTTNIQAGTPPTSLFMPTEGKMTERQDENADAPKRALDHLPSKPLANIFPGQDYSNPRIKDFLKLGEKPFEDIIPRDHTARMPWHDIACTFRKRPGEENIEGPVDDLVWHFIQRWNFAKWEKKKADHVIPWLYPSQCLIQQTPEEATGSLQIQILRSASQWSAGTPREKSINNAYIDLIRNSKHYVYIENQFFITKFSSPSPHVQHQSPQGKEPPHFNRRGQKLPISRVRVHNPIASTLAHRILVAHAKGEQYRAYIIIPLFPAFHGDVTKGDSDPALPYVLSAQTECIRGLLDELEKGGISKDQLGKYICFVGLRKWDVLGNRLVTEQVYVHAKILLVDDRYALIGSANINDRSQMGSRDSELAILLTDTKGITTTMASNPYPNASNFVYSLRLRLFHEHLGVPFPPAMTDVYSADETHKPEEYSTEPALLDPVSDACWEFWTTTLDINTRTLRHVFHVVPDDTVKNWKDYKDFLRTRGGEVEENMEKHMNDMAKEQGVPLTLRVKDLMDDQELARDTTETGDVLLNESDGDLLAKEILEKRVRGHAVRFPVHFLEEEELSRLFKGLHQLAPRRVFT
ncbi:uncharacterized protein SPPG_02618 [Spizellomyces punctatus DAOM BR117]|uniref:Phospholipase n=1 Tax=Spizellomyces punctatus (strain DAOM BR117) TaxID=645134 RepID=A0A0L0HMV3_SPIPD|nr:uncharacterized protein SPPG_02618 [Spizellomyces punctatus DAOM BR117]KND02124.1 hypothetical protein SPPG_02618 [Spizellomyces punctatus DAOM BR117]|eukprot:XP_016610163.1 hypothetical protein SPPG_02618 [Spizellomyces punctatus DAOM BR117]